MKSNNIYFNKIRNDWYNSNSVLPGLFKQNLKGRKNTFVAFPKHWIPIFEWYKIPWKGSSEPINHIPFFSDLNLQKILEIVEAAKKNGRLRVLVESVSMFDPVIVDFLHNMDHSSKYHSHLKEDLLELENSNDHNLILTGWQGYGRPIIKSLEEKILTRHRKSNKCIVVPCSVQRPYNSSKKHKKIKKKLLEEHSINSQDYDLIVFTSIGVIPEALWEEPAVLNYDARVPDVYRILNLARKFFDLNRYSEVIDCSNFRPYNDILNILSLEAIIPKPHKIDLTPKKHYHLNFK